LAPHRPPTAAERKVVRILTTQYPVAGLESLPKLAERANVSAPAVLRLLTKLGYGSYAEFQQALLDEVRERASDPAGCTRSAEQPISNDGLDAEFETRSLAVTGTADRLERGEFRAVVGLLSDLRRQVVTVGGLEGDICSQHLRLQLAQIRSGVTHAHGTPAGMPVDLLDVGKQHVVVAFDFRRYQRSTIDFVRWAARQHAATVLFTDRWLSPAADYAAHVFICDNRGDGPFDSLVGAIALVEALVAAIAVNLGPRPTGST
jgi:DNA-binding MurR/RpiR family transcriptional regulator